MKTGDCGTGDRGVVEPWVRGRFSDAVRDGPAEGLLEGGFDVCWRRIVG